MTTPTPPKGFAEAIDQFNSWRFYDAHETLEDIWRETGPKGDDATLTNFYQGIIKAAAGYHHLLRGNYNGVIKVLGDAPRLLEPYTPSTMGVDVAALIAAIRDTIARVEALGPDQLGQFERNRIPAIDWNEKPVEVCSPNPASETAHR